MKPGCSTRTVAYVYMRKGMRSFRILFISLSFILLWGFSCDKEDDPGRKLPSCIQANIDSIQQEPVANPPTRIFRYQYQDQTVYKFTAACCDQLTLVFSTECEYLCAPTGGFTGLGDGNCPDFGEKASQEELVWEDDR